MKNNLTSLREGLEVDDGVRPFDVRYDKQKSMILSLDCWWKWTLERRGITF